MLRLTREVRFAINRSPDAGNIPASNGYAGVPPLVGIGTFLTLRVTLEGTAHPRTGYLRNIKEVDEVVRAQAIPLIDQFMRRGTDGGLALPARLMEKLRDAWPGASLAALTLHLSPFLSVGCESREYPMVRLSQKFEFSASHRLHNPAMDDAANRAAFGKCNNPHGHGHNYELQVTLRGTPDRNGLLVPVPEFERIVGETVIDRFDHKNLNVEVPEFRELNPSVENIARVIHGLLKPRFSGETKLASVTVWETPKTWCEYAEE